MNLIGQTIKTHEHGYVGIVAEQNVTKVGAFARLINGINPNEAYVAYAVRLANGKPTEWTTVIAKSDEAVLERYLA